MLPTTIYPDGDEIFFSPLAKKETNKMGKKEGVEGRSSKYIFRTTAASGVLNDCLAPLKPDVLIKLKCPDQYVSSQAFLK